MQSNSNKQCKHEHNANLDYARGMRALCAGYARSMQQRNRKDYHNNRNRNIREINNILKTWYVYEWAYLYALAYDVHMHAYIYIYVYICMFM